MRCHPERAWRGIVSPKVAREGQEECAHRVVSSSSSSNDDECCRCRSCRRSFPSGFELHRCDDGFGSPEEFCVLDLNLPPPPHGGGGGSPASSISDLC
ncbi:hypothetical protein QJS04_geneDACA009726 [Acorus gramineus]|uniref:Uncharacterized protein n=1 Tax=Acorus gramineus TaxID=55184 RepID=A0AAV9B7G2_ACOGR|nr:hypothetical protein QJS04_geneDACA009726 [Acorus gramineus]